MKRREFILASLALSGCSTAGIKLDAPYVSTPQSVVEHALPAMRGSFYELDRSSDVFTWDPV